MNLFSWGWERPHTRLENVPFLLIYRYTCFVGHTKNSPHFTEQVHSHTGFYYQLKTKTLKLKKQNQNIWPQPSCWTCSRHRPIPRTASRFGPEVPSPHFRSPTYPSLCKTYFENERGTVARLKKEITIDHQPKHKWNDAGWLESSGTRDPVSEVASQRTNICWYVAEVVSSHFSHMLQNSPRNSWMGAWLAGRLFVCSC